MPKKRNVMSGGLAMMSLATLFAFQNCSDGYSAHKHDLSEEATHNLAHVSSPSLKMEPGMDLTFVAEGTAITDKAAFKWNHLFNGINKGCTEKTSTTEGTYTVSCPGNGDLTLIVTVSEDGSEFSINYEVGIAAPAIPPTMGNEIPLTVVFEIPAGTGANAWNATNQPVEVFVGQTLQIKNSDSVVHQLHTGGRPCGHGQPIKPGEIGNCIVKQSYDRAKNGAIYDHNLGTKSTLYAVAHDGVQLYNNHCMTCHGAFTASTVSGAKVSLIKSQFTSNVTMQIPALMNLTDRQLQAISYALGGR